jgi:hypothetical protein
MGGTGGNILGDLSSLDGYDPSKTMAALGLEPGDFINLVMAESVWRREASQPEQGDIGFQV